MALDITLAGCRTGLTDSTALVPTSRFTRDHLNASLLARIWGKRLSDSKDPFTLPFDTSAVLDLRLNENTMAIRVAQHEYTL